MSDVTLAKPTPQVAPSIDVFDDAHFQFTPLSNEAEQARMNSGTTWDPSGSFLASSCDGGVASCDTPDGTGFTANPLDKSVGAKRAIAPKTNLGFAVEDHGALTNERMALGGRASGTFDTAVDPNSSGQSLLSANAQLDAKTEQSGTFEKRSDGRYTVRYSAAENLAGGAGGSRCVGGGPRSRWRGRPGPRRP